MLTTNKPLFADYYHYNALGLEAALKEINLTNHFQVINVVGTNGKGSTCQALAFALEQHYQKVGLFLSPAFLFHNERIQINHQVISDQFIVNFKKKYQWLFQKYRLNFFAIWVILMVLYFNQQKVDIAVIEAGIGGRHDATYCLNYQKAVLLTSVSYDHTDVLGESIQSILANKVGIIKKASTPLLVASSNKPYFKEIIKLHAYAFLSNNLFKNQNEPPTQQDNIALVKTVLTYFRLNNYKIWLTCNKLLGRYQLFKIKQQTLLLDGAHNPDALVHLINYQKTILPKASYLLAFSKKKAIEKMLKIMQTSKSNCTFASFVHPKSWEASLYVNQLVVCEDWKVFLKKQIEQKQDLVICGSLYFLPLVLEWLQKNYTQ